MNVGWPVLILLLVAAGYIYYRSNEQHERSRTIVYDSSGNVVGKSGGDNRGATAGQYVANETHPLKEGQAVTYTVSAGDYHVRVVSDHKGITAKWSGTSCPSISSERTLYETDCSVAAPSTFTVENPTTFGTGPTENATIVITTR